MAVKKVTPSQGIFFEITPQDIEGMQFEQIAQMLHQKGIKNKIKFFTPKCKEDGPKHPFSSDGAAVEFLNSLNKRLVELRGMELVAAGISSSTFVRFPTGQIITQLDPIFRILFFALERILCIIGLYIPEPIHSMILDGRLVAATILENIQQQITRSTSHDRPMLAVVLVGENPASMSYIRMKEKRAREVGMGFGLYRYDATITQGELEAAVRELSANDKIHGIIVQSPLPSHIDPYAVIDCIDPDKDVDGFTKSQIGNMFLGHDGLHSCTPKGIMTMLKYYHIDVSGKSVVVIGRSNIVGKPMTLMLVNAGATVTSCNSKTSNLSEITQKADIIIVAAGKPGLLTRDMVTPRSIVIDVGCTFVDGIACGDTDFENIKDSVAAISPVPGGVGPMTVATLIENTWKAFESKKRDNYGKINMNYHDALLRTINSWKIFPIIDEWLFENFRQKYIHTMSSFDAFDAINETVSVLLSENDESAIVEILETIITLARQSDTTETPHSLISNRIALIRKFSVLDSYSQDKLGELFSYYRMQLV